MKSIQAKHGFLVKLSKGENLSENIIKFALAQKLNSGVFYAIGALLEVEIGFYNLETHAYEFKTIKKPLEIASMIGNLSYFENQPILHIHAVLSDENLNCFGGHVNNAVIGGTCEIYFTPLEVSLKRSVDTQTGLKLWDI